MLHKQGLDNLVCDALALTPPPADLTVWDRLVDAIEHPLHQVRIGMVGKYVDLTESYKSLHAAMVHACITTNYKVATEELAPEQIHDGGTRCLQGLDALLVQRG